MDRREILERYSRGEISARQAVAALGIGHGELYMLMRAEAVPLPQPTKERLEHEVRAGVALCLRAARRSQ